jgi:drug/metabolite transporter (DMT)-like permease
MPSRSHRAVLLVPLLALLWGGSWPMFNIVLRELSVWTFRAIAVGTAGLAMMLVVRLLGIPLAVPAGRWPRLLAAALGNITVWYVSATAAILYIPSGNAAVLGYTMPLWAALIAIVFLRQPPTGRIALALVLGACAVGLMAWPNLAHFARAPLGIGFALLAGIAWACGTLIVKHTDWGGLHPLSLTAWQLTLGAVPIAVGALFFADLKAFLPSTTVIVLVAVLALVPTALGTLVWFRIVDLLPAQVASLSSIMVPIVAMAGGIALHDEPFGLPQAGALLCTVAALFLALTPPRGRTGHRQAPHA